MKKVALERKIDEAITETRNALQLVYDSLNNGQQNKLLKNEEVVKLFERYNVVTD